jgi:hypothetical protein
MLRTRGFGHWRCMALLEAIDSWKRKLRKEIPE